MMLKITELVPNAVINESVLLEYTQGRKYGGGRGFKYFLWLRPRPPFFLLYFLNHQLETTPQSL